MAFGTNQDLALAGYPGTYRPGANTWSHAGNVVPAPTTPSIAPPPAHRDWSVPPSGQKHPPQLLDAVRQSVSSVVPGLWATTGEAGFVGQKPPQYAPAASGPGIGSIYQQTIDAVSKNVIPALAKAHGAASDWMSDRIMEPLGTMGVLPTASVATSQAPKPTAPTPVADAQNQAKDQTKNIPANVGTPAPQQPKPEGTGWAEDQKMGIRYDMQGDKVSKTMGGQPMPMNGTFSVMDFSGARAMSDKLAAQRGGAGGGFGVQMPEGPQAPSRYELELAARNASIGNDHGEKAKLAMLLHQKDLAEQYKAAMGLKAMDLAGIGVTAGAHADAAQAAALQHLYGAQLGADAKIQAAQIRAGAGGAHRYRAKLPVPDGKGGLAKDKNQQLQLMDQDFDSSEGIIKAKQALAAQLANEQFAQKNAEHQWYDPRDWGTVAPEDMEDGGAALKMDYYRKALGQLGVN